MHTAETRLIVMHTAETRLIVMHTAETRLIVMHSGHSNISFAEFYVHMYDLFNTEFLFLNPLPTMHRKQHIKPPYYTPSNKENSPCNVN